MAGLQLATLIQMFTFYIFGFMNPDVWNKPQIECTANDNSEIAIFDGSTTFENINVTRQFLDYFKGIFWMSVVKFCFMMPSFFIKARGSLVILSKGHWDI